MTAIVARGAQSSLVSLRANANVRSDRRVISHDYSLFDHVDHGRAASDYSRSRGAKGADALRKAFYLLAICCL